MKISKNWNKIKFKRKLYRISKFDNLLKSMETCSSISSIRVQLIIFYSKYKPTKNEKKIFTNKLNLFINEKVKKIENELPF